MVIAHVQKGNVSTWAFEGMGRGAPACKAVMTKGTEGSRKWKKGSKKERATSPSSLLCPSPPLSHCGTEPDLLVDGQTLVWVHGNEDGSRVGVNLVTVEANAQVGVDAVYINVGDVRHVGHAILRPQPCTPNNHHYQGGVISVT